MPMPGSLTEEFDDQEGAGRNIGGVENEEAAAVSTWDGEVDGEEPVQTTRGGRGFKRYGEPYLSGTLWAKDRLERRAARLTYEVYPVRHMVLLGNVDADGSVGDAGDVRGRGAGRALMDSSTTGTRRRTGGSPPTPGPTTAPRAWR